MYAPKLFREDRLDVLQDFIAAHPLGTLVTHGPEGLTANQIPFLIDAGAGEKGTLRAHLARANPQLADLRAGAEALIVFRGPDAYVAPIWYPSKAEHGKVVPTWNYVAVNVWGLPKVVEDQDWLRTHIDELTATQEQHREHPWASTDAPDDYIRANLKGIAGIEIPIERILGKWKVSQNRSEEDRQGVVEGMKREGPAAREMARLVERHGR